MAAVTRPRSFEELWQALQDVPEHLTGEIVEGEIVAHARPAAPHLEASARLGSLLGPAFTLGTGGPGPGGWVILYEPGIRFGDQYRIPDMAGWRTERYARPKGNGPYLVMPDWVCEFLSKSTAVDDRTKKLPLYARYNVRHAWFIDAAARTLEVFRLVGEQWMLAQTFGGDTKARAEPFDAIEIDLSLVWGAVVDGDE
jgi:Uma2 family endonuclease